MRNVAFAAPFPHALRPRRRPFLPFARANRWRKMAGLPFVLMLGENKTERKHMTRLWLAAGLLFASATAYADTFIGRCTFKGSQPRKHLIHGSSLDIYYSGDVRTTGSVGPVTIWKGTGDVWVIRHNPEAAKNNRFEIQGTLQTCDDF